MGRPTTGQPVAFIETAWRRYTKHSRNKVQEIHGAIEPLAETYRDLRPFKGAILAGVFTSGAITQLESLGFAVVYVPCESVVKAFQQCGVDARFDEQTPDREFERKVAAFQGLEQRQRKMLARRLLRQFRRELDVFLDNLSRAVLRRIERIVILVLHGKPHETATIDDAVSFVESYQEDALASPVDRYEIQIRYTNGDSILACFHDKHEAVRFLRTHQQPT